MSAPANLHNIPAHTKSNPVDQEPAVQLEPPNTIVCKQDGNTSIYQVLEKESGRVIYQLPSEEVLRVAKKLEEVSMAEEPGQQIDSKY